MNSRLLTASLIAVPALIALKPIADTVLFEPEAGSSASKDYRIDVNFSLGDLTATVDGQDMSEMVPGDFELSMEMLMNVTDLYVASSDGRPTELIRTFDELSMTWETPDDSGEDDELGDLEGKHVRFVWNADSEEYEKSFHECEGDEDKLQPLSPETDLQALLPDGEVSDGDSWVVEAEHLKSLLIFGTDTSTVDMNDGGEEWALIQSELMPQLDELLAEFEVTCTYQGTRDVNGKRVGVIAVAIDAEGYVDLAGLIEQVAASQLPPEIEIDLTIDEAGLSIAVEGSGELLWNLEANLFLSYEMHSEVEILGDLAVAVDVQGEAHDLEVSAEVLGEITWSASVTD